MRKQFELTQEELADIIAINKNQMPVMKFGDHWTGLDLQEQINTYWEKLGEIYGYDSKTVEALDGNKYTAEVI